MDYIYIDNYASLLESAFIDAEKTYCLNKANIVVNPLIGTLFNKKIVINLPIEIPIEDLLNSCNAVISRFPIGYGIHCIPYELQTNRSDVDEDDLSCILLQDYMLTDMEYLNFVKNNKFLLGINEVIDNESTLIGMKILENKVENLVTAVDQGSKP